MKRILLLLAFFTTVSTIVVAQDDQKDKAKKTSTVPQKVKNSVSRHKHYSGTKAKHKHGDNKVKDVNGNVKEKKDL
jgi:hypothetical protein